MKQIKQQSEITFSAISIQDAFKLIPIMDSLAESTIRQQELSISIADFKNNLTIRISPEQAEIILKVMRKIGFVSTLDDEIE